MVVETPFGSFEAVMEMFPPNTFQRMPCIRCVVFLFMQYKGPFRHFPGLDANRVRSASAWPNRRMLPVCPNTESKIK